MLIGSMQEESLSSTSLLPVNFFALSPEVLQAIELAQLTVHDVHHDIDVIQHHPARIRIALRIDRMHLMISR